MAAGTIGGTPISQLPESSFAYCESGPLAVSERCHFPIRDKNGKADPAHVRNALARLSGSPFEAQARPKVEAAAKELGIGAPADGKALGEVKAEPMSTSQLDRWLTGKIPRRILMLPFGGPIGGKDLDGQYFDASTDIYGPYEALRASRERVVDWHHGKDPTGLTKGAIIGHLAFDEEPEEDGYWADFWANAGEKRRALVAQLERRSVPLYGSTEAPRGTRQLWPAKADGLLPVWPVIRHTITTSPQNTYAVVPALKAALDAPTLDEIPAEALKALLVGLDAEQLDLLLDPSEAAVLTAATSSPGAAKAGRVLSSKNLLLLEQAIGTLRQLLASGALLPDEDEEALAP
jgi:hypothetical protein